MAAFSNKPSLYDNVEYQDDPQAPISQVDEWARSEKRGGWVNGTDQKHIPQINFIVQAIQSGQISEAGVENLSKRVKGLEPYIKSALASRIAASRANKEIGQYFDPGAPATPDKPYTDQDVGSGVGPYQIGAQVMGTGTPARPQRMDFDSAAARAYQMGNFELADKLMKAKKDAQGNTGLYGGIQYAFDPKTRQYVPYSVDERTREPVKINTPSGTQATVPMVPQITQGGEISMIPSRGIPGTPSAVTGTGARTQATPEEAKQVGQAQSAFDMAAEMKDLVDTDKVKVGPIEGRKLRAAGMTGVNLTPEDAKVISIEQNLSNQLLQAMRGAQVGPQEQEMFNRSLPRVDQPKSLFLQNIDTTMKNLETMRQKASQLRPVPPPNNPVKEKPKKSQSFSDDEYNAKRKALLGR